LKCRRNARHFIDLDVEKKSIGADATVRAICDFDRILDEPAPTGNVGLHFEYTVFSGSVGLPGDIDSCAIAGRLDLKNCDRGIPIVCEMKTSGR
jgi:hypothetical protein